jgi:hypothetical protein
MPERFATLTETGRAPLSNATERGRSDRADRPLIAIDPLLESRHKACGIALNAPERASRLASHGQLTPRLLERKECGRQWTRKHRELSANSRHSVTRSALNATERWHQR